MQGHDYHRLSLADKRRHAIHRQRAPATRCPHCLTEVTSGDLLDHVRERCEGRPPIHPRHTWVAWRAALELGISNETLRRLTEDGTIRNRPKKRGRGREYLELDIVQYLARRLLPGAGVARCQ